MKVQMQGQSLRFRIDEAELAALQAGQVVDNLTRFPGGSLRHSVVLADAVDPALDDGLRLHLPRALLGPYVARLPCRDGLAIRLPLGDGSGDAIEIDFEVDVRDSVRSRGIAKR